MFAISNEAAVLICRLLAGAGLPATAGLRLSTDPEKNSLAMCLAARPRERDVLLTHDGASLFLSPTAAMRTKPTDPAREGREALDVLPGPWPEDGPSAASAAVRDRAVQLAEVAVEGDTPTYPRPF